MRRVGIFGTCISTAWAIGAIVAGGALASPPEFSAPFPDSFTSGSHAMTFETVSKFTVSCVAGTNNGEVTGPATAVVTMTFTGCVGEGGVGSCQNHSTGEIVTERLAGTLGYLNRKHTAVGLDLSNPTGGAIMRFFCGEDLSVEVIDSVIGRITPINTLVAAGGHVTLKLAQKEGHQAIKRLLGGARDAPMAKVLFGSLEEAGISTTDVLAFGAPIEIVA
jgi:hypothetical protein